VSNCTRLNQQILSVTSGTTVTCHAERDATTTNCPI
jgi:hypothetical protein